MNTLLLVILLAVCIGFPLFHAWRLWRMDRPSRLGWLIRAADASIWVALVMIVGRWDIAGGYTRLLLLLLFAAALVWSARRHLGRPWRTDKDGTFWRGDGQVLASAVMFGAALIYVSSGLWPEAEAKRLSFPLRGGVFMIAHGGGVQLINYHASHRPQRRALDITALNPLGFRAAGLLPKDLHAYVIYGATVVSPCAGRVIETRNDLPDLIPPRADPDNAAGNHIVLRCGDVDVVLAHLMPGSVQVSAGDPVAAGAPVARVGNTGNTSEPHLHIHAVDPSSGRGVPIRFDGVTPVRNSVFRR